MDWDRRIKIDNAKLPWSVYDCWTWRRNCTEMVKLIDMLEDCDDVQNVYHNGEISDEIAAML